MADADSGARNVVKLSGRGIEVIGGQRKWQKNSQLSVKITAGVTEAKADIKVFMKSKSEINIFFIPHAPH
jgi:hypothetical protein